MPGRSGGCGAPGLYLALSGRPGCAKPRCENRVGSLTPAPVCTSPACTSPACLDLSAATHRLAEQARQSRRASPWAAGHQLLLPPGTTMYFPDTFIFSLPMIFARLKSLFPLPSLMSSAVHFRNKYLIRWKKQLLITHLIVGVF